MDGTETQGCIERKGGLELFAFPLLVNPVIFFFSSKGTFIIYISKAKT